MRATVTLCLAALALACQNTGALHLRSVAEEDVDFKTFRTYATAPPPAATDLPEYSEITGRRFTERIAAALENGGLVAAPWEEADLQLALTINGQARTDIWAWHVSVVASSVGSMRMLRGSLRVDAYDRRSDRVVWHGSAWQETMNAAVGEERGLLAIDRLMARFGTTSRTP